MQEFLAPRWAPHTLPKLDSDKQILATYTYLDRPSVHEEMRMVVEHLDKDGLGNVSGTSDCWAVYTDSL